MYFYSSIAILLLHNLPFPQLCAVLLQSCLCSDATHELPYPLVVLHSKLHMALFLQVDVGVPRGDEPVEPINEPVKLLRTLMAHSGAICCTDLQHVSIHLGYSMCHQIYTLAFHMV